jgi:nucleotide-binding universal stress UspA family protein
VYLRILVPTDGSAAAHLAAEAAIALVRGSGGDLVVLSVASPRQLARSLDAPLGAADCVRIDGGLEQAHAHVGAIARRARRAGVDCAAVAKLGPDTSRAIIDAAREYCCDLVLMGAHGEAGRMDMPAGQVAQAVLADAPLTVMLLRPAPVR